MEIKDTISESKALLSNFQKSHRLHRVFPLNLVFKLTIENQKEKATMNFPSAVQGIGVSGRIYR